ncbi:Vacuolar protein sorting 24A (Vps24A) [Monocercomonoides exilis]|uniref:Vacuolar protein sorting 24A (Vps24A) n=1 Tax=Monocercomonoides exilis TaxID=2049356 RepID=UPI0035599F07|nr:Vacuolar protein sorting 24A (Vps24A) [Monocercomonoides exilis]|eukprot:MONOS_591.1-p1 / transcript=MONOS_591.1 / gene=MONOS_591 / organism=Monocercomonoides_exilis_PA203 / gene_product= Vacuolar protein sorting 24A (Vps24A) / transcript_product= Vacuolar protein sorting 24A (Vps24A) / location=Mono_scaffold00009:207714-208533(+) / protein_length=216 / sequence_SO=supercontig / SO=protein_coding / is_pseudo=false
MGPNTSQSDAQLQKSKDDPKELIREWKRSIRRAKRETDKQIRDIENGEQKVKREIRDCLQRNDNVNAKVLAKEIVRSKKSRERLYTASSHLDSIESELQHQYAIYRTTKAIEGASGIIGHMNECFKLPSLRETMQDLSREMMKAGVVDEMITETMDDMDEDLDEEADAEVEKTIQSILDGSFEKISTKKISEPAKTEEHPSELDNRLMAVRSGES